MLLDRLIKAYRRYRIQKIGKQIVDAQAANNWRLSSKLEIDRALIPLFSVPIDLSFLLSIDERIKPVLDWLKRFNIQVRVTAPGMLWDNFGQYGCYSYDGERQVILIDPFEKNVEDKYEFLDSLLHETIHSTAPHVGRGELPPPTDVLTFHKEELIAMEGSGLLGCRLGIKDIAKQKSAPDTIWQEALGQILHTSPYSAEIRSAVTDGFYQARKAVEFVLSTN
ncbi:MAG: hypothetical protein ACLQF0_09170 [Dissulfurispiraceae bacterium]